MIADGEFVARTRRRVRISRPPGFLRGVEQRAGQAVAIVQPPTDSDGFPVGGALVLDDLTDRPDLFDPRRRARRKRQYRQGKAGTLHPWKEYSLTPLSQSSLECPLQLIRHPGLGVTPGLPSHWPARRARRRFFTRQGQPQGRVGAAGACANITPLVLTGVATLAKMWVEGWGWAEWQVIRRRATSE